MSTRYTKKHYVDVAKLLSCSTTYHGTSRKSVDGGIMALTQVILDFADLFAADNPKRCTFHGDHDTGYSEDCKITGFNREQFLAACGLEEKE